MEETKEVKEVKDVEEIKDVEEVEDIFDYDSDGLDMKWVNDFAEEDVKYADFYEDDIHSIKLRIIYINKNSEIVKVKEERRQLLEPNRISREELLYIVKTNRTLEQKYYGMLSVVKFNIDLSTHDLRSFLKSPSPHLGDMYLTPMNNVDAVTFNKTITALQHLNELMVIFYDVRPTQKPNLSKTKRVRFTPHRNKTSKTGDH